VAVGGGAFDRSIVAGKIGHLAGLGQRQPRSAGYALAGALSKLEQSCPPAGPY
jgi:hypothetical protein